MDQSEVDLTLSTKMEIAGKLVTKEVLMLGDSNG